MRRSLPLVVCTASLLACLPALAVKPHAHAVAHSHAVKSSRSSSAHSGASLHRSSLSKTHGKAATNPHGHLSQISMDTDRATQIQTALIKNGYLTGEPSGKWDAESISAMQKLQSDNGWQTKIMPDSRALIKLGLGSKPEAATQTASVGSPAQ
ncbi:hypothetical protein SAMN05421819_0587 [Bryocella elongata]|uniref:Peptidoglycan binding-like domain-containing protein n=1 Tax=Bryocella elongata TaxID=863522 RepID=A0A1H5TF37_9BACT|nr:peptidoglycan-binding domain-containing protein [Bryocella elongata]SEF61462.1 hypothetical protein SAMN05421819_0587 [Bryocella elongata]